MAGSAALLSQGGCRGSLPEQSPNYYQPDWTGMLGDHPRSFEMAHQLRGGRSVDFSPVTQINETSERVVVGAAINGVGAAYYTYEYRRATQVYDKQSFREIFRRNVTASSIVNECHSAARNDEVEVWNLEA